MAAGMDLSPSFATIEGPCSEDNVSDMEKESLDNVKQVTLGKPPRHVSVMHHCVSSARLIAEANLVCFSLLYNPFFHSLWNCRQEP